MSVWFIPAVCFRRFKVSRQLYLSLLSVLGDKYCPLLEREGGTALLRDVADSSRPYTVIKNLAAQVIERCRRFHDDPEYRSEGEGEDAADPEEEEEEMYG